MSVHEAIQQGIQILSSRCILIFAASGRVSYPTGSELGRKAWPVEALPATTEKWSGGGR
jgi:hypothetical protein